MRSYSALLSMQYLANHGKVEQASTLNNAAEVVDKMLVDESTGLTDVFNGFFTSASDLSADPASGTARAAFSTTSKELTDRLRSLAATIEETRRQALVQMTGVVDAVNEKAEALARVNQLIQASSAYGKPLPSADLLDERDRLAGQLVDLTGATVQTTDSGQATLRFDGLSLVEGNQAAQLKPQFDRGTDSQAPLPTGLINVFLPRGEGSRNQGQGGLVATLGGSIIGGQFGGLLRYAEGAEDWLKGLDEMALKLVSFGTPKEQTWYTKPITDTGPIRTLGTITGGSAYTNGTYTDVPLTGGLGSGAIATVTVAAGAVKTVTLTALGAGYTPGDVLSATQAKLGGTGSGFSVPVSSTITPVFEGMFKVVSGGYDVDKWRDDGEGELVVLKRSERPSLTISSTMISGNDVPWSQSNMTTSPVDQSFIIQVAGGRSSRMREWSDWVASVSSDLSKWRAEEASFTAVHQSLEVQVQQISGVDLDQEATDLLKFQQIYQANSAVIQAAMRMFDALLSATGR
jgi:flagellar hook-associated protein 1 FlgK